MSMYEEHFALAQNGQFLIRIRMCLRQIAMEIAAEPATTPNHDIRVATVRKVLPNLEQWTTSAAETLALSGVTLDTDDKALHDAAIQLVDAAGVIG